MKLDTRFPHAGPRIPVLGDVTSADRKKPTQHEMELTKTLGPIFERKLLNVHLTIVAGGTLATECTDEEHWGRGLAGPGIKFREIAGAGLFTARSANPLWGQARRILSPGFTQTALRRYHDAMASVADDLIENWTANPNVDVHAAMTNATLEVIARAGFSRNLGLFSDTETDSRVVELLAVLARVLEWASESANDIPVLGHIRGFFQEKSLHAGIDRARGYVDDMIADRVAGREEDQDDLLGLMLRTEDPETGDKLPHDNVRDQVLTFLVAGHETTASLLEATLWYLAKHPDQAEAVRAEATDRGFDYDGVAGMRTTRQILNEVLRLWPSVPGFFRVARHDLQLGGYDIPAGHSVFVLALAAQRDPEGWGPDADQFRPSRWESKALREHPDRFFAPFATGPRACIGRAFAMQESALLISRLTAAFDLSIDDPADAPAMRERGSLRPEPFTMKALPL